MGYENINTYEEKADALFKYYKDFSETWTFKTFTNRLHGLIGAIKKRFCTTDDVQEFFRFFLERENKPCELLYEIFGIKTEEPITKLGPFRIYNYTLAKGILFEKYPELIKNKIFLPEKEITYLLGIDVVAREGNKAVEIGDEYCNSIETVFNYIVGDIKKRHYVGIFNYHGWRNFSTILCYKDSIGHSGRNVPALPIHIKKSVSGGSNYTYLWNLIIKTNKTEIEKRILNSVEWIGKAIIDRDDSKSLVQFVFAIEGMLQYNEGGFITASIVSQMSDWLAFIIQDNPEERMKIAKYFKTTYQKRSAIAHGADTDITIDDLHIAQQLSTLMIQAFINTEPFNKMKTIKELSEYMAKMKYQ